MKSSRAIWNPTKDFWESLRRDNPLGVLGEDLKSLAFGSWFTSICHVLPTYRVDYHAGKPMESVVYCLDISISIAICCKQYEHHVTTVAILDGKITATKLEQLQRW